MVVESQTSSTRSFCTEAASIDLDMVYSVASFALSSVVARKVFLVAKQLKWRNVVVSRFAFTLLPLFSLFLPFHHFDDAHVSQ